MVSPILFNIALIGVPPLLDKILEVRHVLHADDNTMWSSTGSVGAMESRLQEAADVVSDYVKSCGLSCAPQKSELVLVSSRKKYASDSPTINTQLKGHNIVLSQSVKILGMVFQSDHSNTT
ncbi:hypothetical protein HPB49_008984 [Dermacentor silvarum]|uniref:Uncharacterized protein n=1 Tax=Dermacentor silvarum TaxID=543639 RepID=A0ACB8DBX8_DERSI|nr:hypothetical protein HPB49_008984 [Dermacentor silvarum]